MLLLQFGDRLSKEKRMQKHLKSGNIVKVPGIRFITVNFMTWFLILKPALLPPRPIIPTFSDINRCIMSQHDDDVLRLANYNPYVRFQTQQLLFSSEASWSEPLLKKTSDAAREVMKARQKGLARLLNRSSSPNVIEYFVGILYSIPVMDATLALDELRMLSLYKSLPYWDGDGDRAVDPQYIRGSWDTILDAFAQNVVHEHHTRPNVINIHLPFNPEIYESVPIAVWHESIIFGFGHLIYRIAPNEYLYIFGIILGEMIYYHQYKKSS